MAWWKALRFVRILGAQFGALPASVPLRWRFAKAVLCVGAKQFPPTQAQELANRIAGLGASYIKLGQFLATRPDLIGQELAQALSYLQDRLQPFSQAQAQKLLATHCPQAKDIKLGKAVAAASIAQVHHGTRKSKPVAVKLLRPNILASIERELALFARLAGWFMRWHKEGQRLRPRAAVEILQQTVRHECDLRLEAAALAEMADNTKNDTGFLLPQPHWDATSQDVLVSDWMEGVRIDDLAQLKQQKQDLPALADRLIHCFLTQALRDGFFHADMHPGNVLVAKTGDIIALDFGIMGRLDSPTRYFLAQLLHGFITRDYTKLASVHFRAGYVPATQDQNEFANALRAIGEPLHQAPDTAISMGQLLEQLFATTKKFGMEMQPQLLLLQKTMLVVEGIARQLNPKLNIWTSATPAIEAWMKHELGLGGLVKKLADNREQIEWLLHNFPALLAKLQEGATPQPPAPPPPPKKALSARWAVFFFVLALLGALALSQSSWLDFVK